MMRKHRPTHLLWRAVALHRPAVASRHWQRRRLRSVAHLRVGGRSAARPYRRALAQGRRRRRARRHRLDRTVADLPEQPARRHPLWLDRQAGAGLRGAHRRREGPRARRRRDRRIDRARAVGRRRLLEPARQKPAHLCRRMDLYRRQIPPRRRRLLLLLRTHRRHVQGQRHVGVAVRRRGGAHLARGGAGSRRHRQAGRRRTGQAEGLHRAQERLCRRRRPARKAESCTSRSTRGRGNIRAGSTCAPTCRTPPPARSSASSCATRICRRTRAD